MVVEIGEGSRIDTVLAGLGTQVVGLRSEVVALGVHLGLIQDQVMLVEQIFVVCAAFLLFVTVVIALWSQLNR